MKRVRAWLLATLAWSFAACAVEPHEPVTRVGETPTDPVVGATQAPLVIEPTLELVGLADVYDRLVVTALEFDAEVYLLRADESAGLDGDVVNVRYLFRDGYASTARPDGDLSLQGPGRYRVLVRVHASEPEGASVSLEGAYRRIKNVAKSDEPTPSPAEPTPSPAEPTPSPAEPTPSPAEPTPSPAEPTPSPATPSADDAYKSAPTAVAEALSITSSRAFEFYAGEVEVGAEARHLYVSWDVRTWLRALLAQPLGLTAADAPLRDDMSSPSTVFADTRAEFELIAR